MDMNTWKNNFKRRREIISTVKKLANPEYSLCIEVEVYVFRSMSLG